MDSVNIKGRSPGKISSLLICFVSLVLFADITYAGIATTRHNLSSWSPYSTRAGAQYVAGDNKTTRICVFCHAPHNADSTQAPLWGHMTSSVTVTYKLYSSEFAGKNEPSGISRRCLGCHDGTVSVGALANGWTIDMAGSALNAADDTISNTAWGYIGTDLSSTGHPRHPLSFEYIPTAINHNNKYPNKFDETLDSTNTKMMLDGNGKMQCHTCHDPHNDNGDSEVLPSYAGPDPLWRKENDCGGDNGRVCGTCHLFVRFIADCPDSDYDTAP